jgi:hypothetical protein
MVLSLGFPPGWYVILILSAVVWLILSRYVTRRDRDKSLRFGLIVLAVGIVTEVLGVPLFGLWSYAGGNWPVIVWPVYVAIGSATYLGFIVLQEKL